MLALRRGISCLALSLVCGGVAAQDAGKTEAAAAAAAAMERAQRQAANPMRFILEAGKAKPKPAGEASAGAATTTAAAAPRADAGAITPRMATAPEPVAPTAGQAKLTADSLQRQTVALAVPALEVSGASAPAMPALAALAVAAPALATPARPKLVSMVEPVIPPRALDDAGPLGTIMVDLTIRPDGSVAAVAMVAPVPRQIQRYVVQALEQWRFEPLPAERLHRVQLVFNSER